MRRRDFAGSSARCATGNDVVILVEGCRQNCLAFASTAHAVLAHESPRSIVWTIESTTIGLLIKRAAVGLKGYADLPLVTTS